MKTILTAAALATLALCAGPARAATCGPRSQQAISELKQAKAGLSNVLPPRASAGDRRAFNTGVMQPLQKAIRWLENNCRDEPARNSRGGNGRPGTNRRDGR
jgi:hypothetical protein